MKKAEEGLPRSRALGRNNYDFGATLFSPRSAASEMAGSG